MSKTALFLPDASIHYPGNTLSLKLKDLRNYIGIWAAVVFVIARASSGTAATLGNRHGPANLVIIKSGKERGASPEAGPENERVSTFARCLYTVVLLAGMLCPGFLGGVALAAEISVSSTHELVKAIRDANASGGNRRIVLDDGVYSLDSNLRITAPGIAIVGRSGDPASVTIEGDKMAPDARVTILITVSADRFELEGITLQKARYHLIQVKGEHDADNVNIRNCVLRDSYQQLLKVTTNQLDDAIASDNGRIENCVFEYSAGVGPQYYIGGIDAHGARNWVVADNTFRNIISPGNSVAEHAVHFWDDSAHNMVERNLIRNCDRGIGFGMGKRGNTGGVIRNNMIYHSKSAGRFADVGISIENSPETQIYNNTIFQEHRYPNAIEYRFERTNGVLIANNLTNRRIASRAGASGTVASNITDVSAEAFIDSSKGNLHLLPSATRIIGSGEMIENLTVDFDGDSRPMGRGVDVGADEVPNPE